MLAEVKRYLPDDFAYNGATAISWLGISAYSLPVPLRQLVGWLCSMATAGLLISAWRRVEWRSPGFGLQYALAVCGTVLISPHTQFYDAGLVVLAILLILEHLAAMDRPVSPAAKLLLVLGFVGFAWFRWAAEQLGFQPLILWPLLTLLWSHRLLAGVGLCSDEAHLSDQRLVVRAG